ncbi:MAG: hypothetical protein L0G89_00025 [Janibacter sp.]|nr:hypothetical protein [Janibacter sp.]
MARYSMKKALAVAPNVLIAMLLTFPVAALLPPLIGLVLFIGGLITVTLLISGFGEATAMRLLYFARPATHAEEAALTPALQLLGQRGMGPPLIDIWVLERETAVTTGGVGRRSVLVTGGLLAAVRAGRLPDDQVAALIGHAEATVRSGLTRNDPAVEFWTLPWSLVRVVARVCAARFQWLPAVMLVWHARIVIGVITVVQGIQEGTPGTTAAGIAGGVVIALTYVFPYWERVWERTLRDVGDENLHQVGLAPAYARLLLSQSSSPTIHERAHALTSSPRDDTGQWVTAWHRVRYGGGPEDQSLIGRKASAGGSVLTTPVRRSPQSAGSSSLQPKTRTSHDLSKMSSTMQSR